MKTSLVLIAHGSRQPDANKDLFDLADEIRGSGKYQRVEAAFLELAEPDMRTAARRVAAEVERVILLPYFLSAGVHVKRDLTKLRDELSVEFPKVTVLLAEPLGPHPLLRELVLERAAQVGGSPRREG
jgi:sirohydrochlorin ferrochelatase